MAFFSKRTIVRLPMEIIVNKIKCKKCGDEIESKTVHDFKFWLNGEYENFSVNSELL